jgi:hypothetical protein
MTPQVDSANSRAIWSVETTARIISEPLNELALRAVRVWILTVATADFALGGVVGFRGSRADAPAQFLLRFSFNYRIRLLI